MPQQACEDPLRPSPLLFMARRRLRNGSRKDLIGFYRRMYVSIAFIGIIVRVASTAYELDWARSKKPKNGVTVKERLQLWLHGVGLLSDLYFMFVVCQESKRLSLLSVVFFIAFFATNIAFRYYFVALIPLFQAIGLFSLSMRLKSPQITATITVV